ncbi:MAG: hypothetical protein AAF541_10530 [Pseudomonadota bacterium]
MTDSNPFINRHDPEITACNIIHGIELVKRTIFVDHTDSSTLDFDSREALLLVLEGVGGAAQDILAHLTKFDSSVTSNEQTREMESSAAS